MNDTIDTAVSPPKPKRKIAKILGRGLLGLLALALAGHFVWVASGSNQWELAREKDGIKLWTLKSPGSGLVRVKGEARIKSSVSGMVKLLEEFDNSIEGFDMDVKVIREIASTPRNRAIYSQFKFEIPIPGVQTRDYVLFSERFQDPETKRVEINLMAAPDIVPRDPCCVRVTHLHNNWKLTPLKNGELDIEFTQDTDDGGFPYLIQNIFLTEGTHMILDQMRGLMKLEKFQHARVASILELDPS